MRGVRRIAVKKEKLSKWFLDLRFPLVLVTNKFIKGCGNTKD